MARTIKGLTAEQTEKYLEATILVENASRNPAMINQSGFVGNYQMGADALKDAGLVKNIPGITNRDLTNDSVWVPPASWTKFSSDPDMQTSAMIAYTNKNYDTLAGKDRTNGNGVKSYQRIDESSSSSDVAANLAAAHLLGAGAIRVGGLSAGVDGNNSSSADRARYMTMVADGIDPVLAKKAIYGGRPGLITGEPVGVSNVASTTTPSEFSGRVYEPRGYTPVIKGMELILTDDGVGSEVSTGPTNNVLDDYANYTYIFTLSVLTKEEVNNPESSYKAGSINNIIIRSGGGLTKSKVDTAYGKMDYYIDNVNIEALVSYNKKSTATNAFSIEFDVYEIHTIGMFLQTLQIAAHDAGYETYIRDAAFLLTVDFMGYDSRGIPTKIEKCSRHIPIRIYNAEMSVNTSGSVYNVRAVVWNEMALQNSVALFDNDIAISGASVLEMLQTGENSLQYVLNSYMSDQARNDNANQTPDEIAIIFPDFSSKKSNYDSNSATVNPAAVSQQPQTRMALTRGGNQTLVQSVETVNSIGRSSMGFTHNHGGSMVPGKENEAYNPFTGITDRNKVKIDAGKRQLTFARSTSIIEAITQVLLESDVGRRSLDTVDSNGMRDWFRIETQVFVGTPSEGNLTTIGSLPKLYVYKIVPYKVSASRFSASNQTSSDMRFLQANAAKKYDYIYTGKNTSVLDFQIKFNNAFYTSILPTHQEGTPEINQTQGGMGGQVVSSPFNTVIGSNPSSQVESADVKVKEANKFSSGVDDYKVSVAKKFYESLINSPVDMITLNLTIMGDPYYLVDSGTGNWSNSGTGSYNTTIDQSMDYQSGEVDILINFRTPLDISDQTGAYKFDKDTGIVHGFSGLYQVITVTNGFDKGKFTQELSLVRRPKQTATEDSSQPSEMNKALVSPEASVARLFNVPFGIVNPLATA